MNRVHRAWLFSTQHNYFLQPSFSLLPPSKLGRTAFYACTKPTQRQLNSHIMNGHGDLNNSQAARQAVELPVDPAHRYRSLAIEANDDDAAIRQLYRPFIMPEPFAANDWVEQLELSTVLKLVESEILVKNQPRLRILVLYGSLRGR